MSEDDVFIVHLHGGSKGTIRDRLSSSRSVVFVVVIRYMVSSSLYSLISKESI